MRSLALAATLSLPAVVIMMGAQLRAQGVWSVSFDHVPNGLSVDPASDSIVNPSRWITMNLPANSQIVPGLFMNTVHVCLIPAGVHRGEVLVVDGNLTNYGVRAYQPWSIVNPYWPGTTLLPLGLRQGTREGDQGVRRSHKQSRA